MGIFNPSSQNFAPGGYNAGLFASDASSFRNTDLGLSENYFTPGWERNYGEVQPDFEQDQYSDPSFFRGAAAPFMTAPAGVSQGHYMQESAESVAGRPADAAVNFAQQYGLPFLGVAAGVRLNQIRIPRSNPGTTGRVAEAGSRFYSSAFTSRSSREAAEAAYRARSTTGLLSGIGGSFGEGIARGFGTMGRVATRGRGIFGSGAAATAVRTGITGGMRAAGAMAGTLALPFLAAEAGLRTLDYGVFEPYIDMRRGAQSIQNNFEDVFFGQEAGGNVVTGFGISSSAAAQAARQINELGTQDLGLSGRAYQAIADYSSRNGLLDDMSDMSELPGRVQEIARQTRGIMATGNISSVKEATDTLAVLKRMGAGTRVDSSRAGLYDSPFAASSEDYARYRENYEQSQEDQRLRRPGDQIAELESENFRELRAEREAVVDDFEPRDTEAGSDGVFRGESDENSRQMVEALRKLVEQNEREYNDRTSRDDRFERAASSLEKLALQGDRQSSEGGSPATRAGAEYLERIRSSGISEASRVFTQMGGYAAMSGVETQQLMGSPVATYGSRIAEHMGLTESAGMLASSSIYAGYQNAIRAGNVSEAARSRIGSAEDVARGVMEGSAQILSGPQFDPLAYAFNKTGEVPTSFVEGLTGDYGTDMAQDPLATQGFLGINRGRIREEMIEQAGGPMAANFQIMMANVEDQYPRSQYTKEVDGREVIDGNALFSIFRSMGASEKQTQQMMAYAVQMQDPENQQRQVDSLRADAAERQRELNAQYGAYGGDTFLGNALYGTYQLGRGIKSELQSVAGSVTEGIGTASDYFSETYNDLLHPQDEALSIVGMSESDVRADAQRVRDNSDRLGEWQETEEGKETLNRLREATGRRHMDAEQVLETTTQILGSDQRLDSPFMLMENSVYTNPVVSKLAPMAFEGYKSRQGISRISNAVNDILNGEIDTATPRDVERARAIVMAENEEQSREAVETFMFSSLGEELGLSDYYETEGVFEGVRNLGRTKIEAEGDGVRYIGNPQQLKTQSRELERTLGLESEEGSLAGLKSLQLGARLMEMTAGGDRDFVDLRETKEYQQFQELTGARHAGEVKENVRKILIKGQQEGALTAAESLQNMSVEESVQTATPEALETTQSFMKKQRALGIDVGRKNESINPMMGLEEVRANYENELLSRNNQAQNAQQVNSTPEMYFDKYSMESLGLSSKALNESSKNLNETSKNFNQAMDGMVEVTRKNMEYLERQMELDERRDARSRISAFDNSGSSWAYPGFPQQRQD